MTVRPTFRQQSIALLKRNILLKQRNGTHLSFRSLAIFAIIVIILNKLDINLDVIQPIPDPIGKGTNWLDRNSKEPTKWIISPKNTFTQSLELEIKKTLNLMRVKTSYDFTYFSAEELKEYQQKQWNFHTVAAVFHNKTSSEVKYMLQMPNSGLKFRTTDIFGQIDMCRENPFKDDAYDDLFGTTCPTMLYYINGYTFVQTVIDSAIIRILNLNNNTDYGVIPSADLFIYPKPLTKSRIDWAVNAVVISCFIIFFDIIPLMTANLVEEKEKRIKEAMFMMGLRPTVYWFVWFTIELFFTLILIVLLVIVLIFKRIIKLSYILVVFPLLFLFSVTLVEIAAIFSIFFDKEMTATQVVPIIFALFFASAGVVCFVSFSLIPSYLLTILSPVALVFGIRSVFNRKTTINQTLMQLFPFKQIFTITFINDFSLTPYTIFFGSEISIGIIIIILFFDVLLYGCLTLYLDQVVPGNFGAKRHPFFCLMSKSKTSSIGDKIKQEKGTDIEEVTNDIKDKGLINIQNISMKFDDCLAVNDISFTIYESQITALLGHNGAGKTTLINLLLGAISPTSGTAYIYGKDVTKGSEMAELRSMFGVCLQENILFDELDSEEHLLFFGEMKGMEGQVLRQAVDELLRDIELYQNRFTQTKDLSGGQKRKLCIAIAMIASPKVVILDEPTSGVDTAIRQQIWKIIRSYKSDKTIIMTTHDMEEVDLMSDRKAIISKGRLRCVGSSLFLKRKFGVGYHLTIELITNETSNENNIKEITSIVEKEIPNSKFERFIGSEVFYILPQNESKKFSKLFSKLDEKISEQKTISSYGLSMSSLEEVFLRLENESVLKNTPNRVNIQEMSLCANKSEPTFFRSFMAFFYIKVLLIIRNPWSLVIQNIMLLVILIVLSIYLKSLKSTSKSLLFSVDIYDKSRAVLKYLNKNNENITQFVSIVNQLGLKTELINDFKFDSLNNSYLSVSIDSFKKDDIQWNWYFNETHTFALPILQNLMANTYLQLMTGSNVQIKTSLNLFDSITGFRYTLHIITKMLFAFFLFFWNLFLGLHFSLEPIHDRETKIIETIRMSGMGFFCYWTVNLAAHSTLLIVESVYFITICALLLNFFICDTILMSLILFIHIFLSIISLMLVYYTFGQIFETKAAAKKLFFIFLILTYYSMLNILMSDYFVHSNLGVIMAIIFSIVCPLTAFLMGLFMICLHGMDLDGELDFTVQLILNEIGICISIVLYFYLLWIADKLRSGAQLLEAFGFAANDQSYHYMDGSPLEDEDVVKERSEVQKQLKTQAFSNEKFPILLINGLRKVFFPEFFDALILVFSKSGKSKKTEVAINNLSFDVKQNNIFGLLGPNGAGKTTAMKIILRQERPTAGMVLINGKKVESAYLHKQIGYCAQHDILLTNITVKEHLILFANIRGIQSDVELVSNKYMDLLGIREHEHKYTEHLSGGTKRKLCYILSLLGPSNLVLLDEPSTGMDPYSKRFFWSTIQNNFGSKSTKSAVLTTHSMEEANALCTRIAIMTKGVMRCIGSVQHLKNKYGSGYVLEIKWTPRLTNPDSVIQIITNIFKEWELRDELLDRLIVDIPQNSVKSLSLIFLSLENMKTNPMNGILEYSFSQTTLEQVFVYFAKERQIINV